MVDSKVMESKAMESRQALADGFERRLGSKEGSRTVANQMGSKRMVSRLGTS